MSHNPAGALMVYALWASLAVVIATGLIMTDGQSPVTIAEQKAAVASGDWSVLAQVAGRDEGGLSEAAEELHEGAANLMLILALIHVAGGVVESRALRRNLVRPMVTGWGKGPDDLQGTIATGGAGGHPCGARGGRRVFRRGCADRSAGGPDGAAFGLRGVGGVCAGPGDGRGRLAPAVALDRLHVQERALAAARGTLTQVIESQFTRWGLTPAKRDVGFLALKGLDVSEIAGLRGVADGTVRAQLTRIYAKAGVSGRAQFAARFVEDLLDEGLPAPESDTAPLSARAGASALAPGQRSD